MVVDVSGVGQLLGAGPSMPVAASYPSHPITDRFSVLMGRDTLIYPAMIFGARGAVPATGNIAPKLLVEIYETFVRGDQAASLAAQRKLHPVRCRASRSQTPGGC